MKMFPLRILLRITACGLALASVTTNQYSTTSSFTHFKEETSQNWTADTDDSKTAETYTEFHSSTAKQNRYPSNTSIETSSQISRQVNRSDFEKTNTNSSSWSDAHIRYRKYVELIVIPTCFIVGCTGNILTMITMTTLPFRRMTWSIVLVCLAIADTNVLCEFALDNTFIADLLGIDILSISNIGCKIFYFFRRVGKMVSAWLVVMICFERFIAICFPLKVKLICTRRKVIISIVVICTIATLFCANSVSNVGLLRSICSRSLVTSETKVRVQVMLLVGSAMSAILPMFILIILTPIICVTLIRNIRVRTLMTTTDQSDPYKRASAMLVSIHLSHIILVLPHFIITNFKFVSQFQPALYNKEAMSISGQIAAVLETINYSVNFFLYVGLNSMFRKRLKGLFSRTSSTSVQELS